MERLIAAIDRFEGQKVVLLSVFYKKMQIKKCEV